MAAPGYIGLLFINSLNSVGMRRPKPQVDVFLFSQYDASRHRPDGVHVSAHVTDALLGNTRVIVFSLAS